MGGRRLVLVYVSVALLQAAAANEDLNFGDPQTALWAIAREQDLVEGRHLEAAAAVEAASKTATEHAQKIVDDQIAAWQAPVRDAIAKAKASGIDAASCLSSIQFNYAFGPVKSAVPLCVIVGRAKWDVEVRKLKAAADNTLDLIIKAQNKIETCASWSIAAFDGLCRQFGLAYIVLMAQDDSNKKAVKPYWNIIDNAPTSIAEGANACVNGAIERAEFGATLAMEQGLECVENYVQKHDM